MPTRDDEETQFAESFKRFKQVRVNDKADGRLTFARAQNDGRQEGPSVNKHLVGLV
jgi:hypothetical protein